jgi:CRP-like cAMP-binding protein
VHRDEETGQVQSKVKEYHSSVMSQLSLSSIGFSAKLIQTIAEKVQPISFEAGEVIVRMRELSSGVFFITEGTAQVMSPSSADGHNVLVRFLHPGEYFGELSLVRLSFTPLPSHLHLHASPFTLYMHASIHAPLHSYTSIHASKCTPLRQHLPVHRCASLLPPPTSSRARPRASAPTLCQTSHDPRPLSIHTYPFTPIHSHLSIHRCAVLYKTDYDLLKMEFPELPSKLEGAVVAREYAQLSPFISEVALFHHLSERDIRLIVSKLERIPVEPGAIVVREGEPLSSLILIGEGAFTASIGIPPPDYEPSFKRSNGDDATESARPSLGPCGSPASVRNSRDGSPQHRASKKSSWSSERSMSGDELDTAAERAAAVMGGGHVLASSSHTDSPVDGSSPEPTPDCIRRSSTGWRNSTASDCAPVAASVLEEAEKRHEVHD